MLSNCTGVNPALGDGRPSAILEDVGTRNRRLRTSRLLIELALERFHGCEECWRSDALTPLREVLEPLRLKHRELTPLLRRLACHCGSKCTLDSYVVAASDEQIRHVTLQRKFRKEYGREFEAFGSFLIRYPMLGAQHPFGKALSRAMRRSVRTRLGPAVWYRATKDLSGPPFTTRDATQVGWANRFNQVGQVYAYFGSDEKTAAVEVLRKPCQGAPLRIEDIEILDSVDVLDLSFTILGEDPSGHWILRSVVDRCGVSEPTEDVDRCRPQYRIPQFMADLARREGLRGILYSSSRPPAYNNPEAPGRNLVVFEPIPNYRVLSQRKVEFDGPDEDVWTLERWSLRPVISTEGDTTIKPVVVIDSQIMNAAPCLRGTDLIDCLEGGRSLCDFLQQFPTATREIAIQALEEAKDSLIARIA